MGAENVKYVLGNGIYIFFSILEVLIFVRILLSWFPINHNSKFMQILGMFTDPILLPVRSMMARSPLGGRGMVLDFSTVIALFLLRLVRTLLMSAIDLL